MTKVETIEDFYKIKFNYLPDNLKNDIGHFNVFKLEDCYAEDAKPIVYTRRDYYKVTMIRGKNLYHYADKSIEVDGTALVFFNPKVPYTFESLTEEKTGFFCIFKELRNNYRVFFRNFGSHLQEVFQFFVIVANIHSSS